MFTFFLLLFGGVDAPLGLNGELRGVSEIGSLWQGFLRGLKGFESNEVRDSDSKNEDEKLKLILPQVLQIHDMFEPARALYSLISMFKHFL